MNPARSFGPAVASGIWTVQWLYWAAPISGMVLAARAHAFIFLNRASTATVNATEQSPAD